MVPSNPGFPSCPCHISVTSSAHQSGSGCAVHFRTPPDEDFHPFTLNRVDLRYRSSRFNVAQQRRFLSTGGDWIGSKGCCRTLAPVVAAPARFLRHAASAVCKGLAALCVGFPPKRWMAALAHCHPFFGGFVGASSLRFKSAFAGFCSIHTFALIEYSNLCWCFLGTS